MDHERVQAVTTTKAHDKTFWDGDPLNPWDIPPRCITRNHRNSATSEFDASMGPPHGRNELTIYRDQSIQSTTEWLNVHYPDAVLNNNNNDTTTSTSAGEIRNWLTHVGGGGGGGGGGWVALAVGVGGWVAVAVAVAVGGWVALAVAVGVAVGWWVAAVHGR